MTSSERRDESRTSNLSRFLRLVNKMCVRRQAEESGISPLDLMDIVKEKATEEGIVLPDRWDDIYQEIAAEESQS